jgi:hypothetical protein
MTDDTYLTTAIAEINQMAREREAQVIEMQKIAAEFDRITAQRPYYALAGLAIGALVGVSFLLWVIYG